MQGNLLGPKYDGTSYWAEIRGKAKFMEAAPRFLIEEQFRPERPEESEEIFPKGIRQICNCAYYSSIFRVLWYYFLLVQLQKTTILYVYYFWIMQPPV